MTEEANVPVKYDEITPAKLRDLIALRERASGGAWSLQSGMIGKDWWITTFSRDYRHRDGESDGPIGHVSGERTISREALYGNGTTYTKREIKAARDDAQMIVQAVNAIKPLCEALLRGDQLDETAWLIEWPANKHNPNRYYAGNGEPPVMSAGDAVRFSRKQDAVSVAKDMKLMTGYMVTEHKWMNLLRSADAT